ncbi:MAG: DASH family cryptochrome [Elainella sp.]
MVEPRILVWYRTDLRLHDHEPLHRALQQNATVIPVYCFDPRQFGQTSFGFPKTGAFRAQFLQESVAELRQSLRELGSDLIIRVGLPEQILPDLVAQLQISAIHSHREITAEEQAVDRGIQQALAERSLTQTQWIDFWGQTLYHPDDLPFDLNNIPDLFTSFRKQVEKRAQIRPMFPPPQQLSALPPVEPGELPSLEVLGLTPPRSDSRTALQHQGGERTGQARLAHYFWQQDHLKQYKQTRNGLLGADYSSKFSAWLAAGCLSPRYIYEQVMAYESQRVANESTYWLIFELLWRDYFRFICAKYGNRIFAVGGIQRLPIAWKQDWPRFERWQQGQTGYPLVDANMRELATTGFMSNRGRQNAASFLTKNLGIDWRMGAEWFESLLIDYDVCSNWGNWNYSAGIGNDARGFRFFNITKQAKDYDPKGRYVKHWLPELAQLPPNKVQEPWTLSPAEQKQYQVRLGVDYPHPIVDLFQSAAANEKIYQAALAAGR